MKHVPFRVVPVQTSLGKRTTWKIGRTLLSRSSPSSVATMDVTKWTKRTTIVAFILLLCCWIGKNQLSSNCKKPTSMYSTWLLAARWDHSSGDVHTRAIYPARALRSILWRRPHHAQFTRPLPLRQKSNFLSKNEIRPNLTNHLGNLNFCAKKLITFLSILHTFRPKIVILPKIAQLIKPWNDKVWQKARKFEYFKFFAAKNSQFWHRKKMTIFLAFGKCVIFGQKVDLWHTLERLERTKAACKASLTVALEAAFKAAARKAKRWGAVNE